MCACPFVCGHFLRISYFSAVGFLKSEILGKWDFGKVGFWDSGILRKWDFGKV